MKDLVVIGAGALGREVAQLIKDINQNKKGWNFLGFIDETPEKHGTIINNDPVLGGFDWIENSRCSDIWTVCAVGNTRGKFGLVQKAKAYGVHFANLLHPSVATNEFIEMGTGNIICWNTFLSVNIKLGSHIVINPGCGIGHDAVIEDYVTLYWDVTLSGNVLIGEGCEIGSKAAVIQKKSVGRWSILGAGAVAIRDIPEGCTAVGMPAKPIKFHSGDFFRGDDLGTV